MRFANSQMHKLTLSFADPDRESDYARRFSERQVTFGRIGLTIGAAFVIGFVLLDIAVAGEALGFCLWVRFGFMTPAVLGGCLALFLPGAHRFATLAQLVPTLFAGWGVAVMTLELPYPASEQYYVGVIVVIVFGHAITHNRFITATLAGLLIIAGYGVCMVVGGVGGWVELQFLLATEVALMFGSYLRELHWRQLYLKQIHLEELSAALEDQAMRDALTGLGNRRAMEVQLRHAHAQGQRYGVETTLLLTDLDYFKRVNDELGHGQGDKFLRGFARRIQSIIRDSDHAFRYGGDEFLVMLPHTSVPDAQIMAQRLLLGAKDLSLEFGVDHLGVGCSIGVAALDTNTSADPLAAVDAALYGAKSKRGEIVVAGQEAVRPPRRIETPVPE